MNAKVKEIMSGILKVDISVLDDDLEIGDIQEWDSLRHMMIVTALEKEFGIKFQREELVDLENVRDIIDLVENKLA
jgi:acyl carrier protein